MADEVQPLSTPTANYGWAKPTVGGDGDAWGGMLNTDLDGIDSIVHNIQTSVPAAASTAPLMNGTATVGTGTTWARADHVHPTDTSLYPNSNPANYVNAAGAASSAPVQSVAGKTGAVTLVHTDITDWAANMPPPYVLPTASTTVLGGVKVDGTTVTIAGGTISASSGYTLPPATTTALGGVKVDGTSIKAATDGTISTVLVPMGDNRIINGDMRIDQRNSGSSGTASAYTVDRWFYTATQANKGNWQRNSITAFAFPYALVFGSSSAYTPLASDTFNFVQPIEADMVSDFLWGSAGAQPVTLSFWASSSLTGTFGGSIQNAAGNRSYPFTYSISVANVMTRIVINIPGDTVGTWVLSGNVRSMNLTFDLGTGATYRGPAGAWAAANYIGATGTVNVVATNAASLQITGVKFEIGNIATPFNRQSLAKSLADCQRYYQTLGSSAGWDVICQSYAAVAGASIGCTVGYPCTMRVNPTATVVGTWTLTNITGTLLSTISAGKTSLGFSLTATAAGQVNVYNGGGAAINLSAEL